MIHTEAPAGPEPAPAIIGLQPGANPLSRPSLYEDVLAALRGGALPQAKPPRASASVVLWRRAGAGLEVFWVKRAEALAFMGGWYAFPGGGLARTDATEPVMGRPRGAEVGINPAMMPETLSEGLADVPAHLIPGIAACALRELAEETGLRVERDGAFDASRLTFAGRWLTPPLGPLRFDNRFFLLEWPEGEPQQPLVTPGELESGEWIAPAAAHARWERGEVLAAPPILHLLRVLAEDGPEAGLPRLLEPHEANLGPFRRVEFRPGVVLLPLPTATLPPAGHTNAFLLGREELVLVDPGAFDPAVLERVVQVIDAAKARGQRVREIWLTHHHPDHIAGAAWLRARLGLPIAAHPATAERVARGVARVAPFTVDRPLADGERVLLAGDPPFAVTIHHTPGHAQGHLCFYDEGGGSLLAGDMLSAISTIVIDPPEGDMDAYLASLEKLRTLGAHTLFPAHGPPIKGAEKHLTELIAHRLAREEKVLAAWQQGLRTPAEMRPLVYEEELPPMVYPLAERQIHAHLLRLRRAGKID